MSEPVELLIFDLDGTLVDSAGEIADTVNDVLRGIGQPALPPDRIRSWIGHGARATVRSALEALRVFDNDAALETHLDELMRRYLQAHELRCGTSSTLFPGVAEALPKLHAGGMRMALATNKEARFTTPLLACHRIAHCFDPIVSGDTLATRKPDAGPVLHAIARHAAGAERTVLIGDSAVDAQTARNAGVAFWAVPWGYNGGRPIESERPDRMLTDFTDLLTLVAERC